MSVETHIQFLNKKHHYLEEKIHEAYIHHLPTSELKKEKLRIKDEIASLANQNNEQYDDKYAA